MAGKVMAVCVAAGLTSVSGRVGVSGIDKRPVDGPVAVRDLGLFADVQCDRAHHGGIDKAVYAYSQEAILGWERELGRELLPGAFGENLRTEGIAIDDAEFGERWRIGTAEFTVSSVRTPCATFQQWMGIDGWVRRFQERGLPGVYLHVAQSGTVQAGDEIEVLSRPGHGVTVARWFTDRDEHLARTLLAAAASGAWRLSDHLRAKAEALVGGR